MTGRENQSDLEQDSEYNLDEKNMWQHPYVDLFKHFKLSPTPDWQVNKRQGDVCELFVRPLFTHISSHLGARDRPKVLFHEWKHQCK